MTLNFCFHIKKVVVVVFKIMCTQQNDTFICSARLNLYMTLSSSYNKLKKKISNFYGKMDDFAEKREIKRIAGLKVKRERLEVQAKRAKVEKKELVLIRKAERAKGERDSERVKLTKERGLRFDNKFGSLGDKYFKEDNIPYRKRKRSGGYFGR